MTADIRRRAAVAGQFYPADPAELLTLVDACLAGPTTQRRSGYGAIVPHAGLVYSGKCVGALFARSALPSTVVILAPNHTGVCNSPGASLWRSGAFETPLGDVRVNENIGATLERACDLVADDRSAHQSEHAIEVELPFLIRCSPHTMIVPIVIAWDDWPRSERLAAALAETVAESRHDVWLLASSDMSHYEPVPDVERKDQLALMRIGRLDGRGLLDVCQRERITMCGRAPAAVVVEAARRLGAVEADVLDYRHSGLVTGTTDRVVGYAAVSIT
jgi:AmmeMemoRadiSam system protein B